MLVIAVSFFHAGGGAAVALMAGRTAKLVGIVNLQQFRLRMADERLRVFVRLLLALWRHRRSSDFQRLARAHVARLAAVDDIRLGDVDLNDRRVPIRSLLLQSVDLRRSQVDHVIGDVLVHLGLGRSHRLQNIAEFQAQLRPLVADFVVSLFQFLEVEFLLAAVGKLDRGLLLLCIRQFLFCLLALADALRAVSYFVGQRIDVRPAVGEYALHRQQSGAGVIQFLARLFRLGFGVVYCLLVSLLQRGVVRILFDIFLRRGRFRLRAVFRNAL